MKNWVERPCGKGMWGGDEFVMEQQVKKIFIE